MLVSSNVMWKIKTYIEAPKWAHLPTFLNKLAWELGVDIEIKVEKHWLRETVFFNASSKEKIVMDKFKAQLDAALAQYNT